MGKYGDRVREVGEMTKVRRERDRIMSMSNYDRFKKKMLEEESIHKERILQEKIEEREIDKYLEHIDFKL